MMITDIGIRLGDFSFGILFMSQLIMTAALYKKGKAHRLQRMMFGFMLFLTLISAFEMVFFYFAQAEKSTLSSCLTDMLEMSVVPCALFIITRLTRPQARQKWLIIINAVVYGAFFVSYAITANEHIYHFALGLSIVYSLSILIYSYLSTRRYNRILLENFSNESLSLYWLKYVLFVYVLILLIWTTATVFPDQYEIIAYNLSMTVILGLFCYFVYRQEDMLEELEASALTLEENREPVKQSADADTLHCEHDFTVNLEAAFVQQQIYLNPTLNLYDLARVLNTNRTYISNFLNQQLHTTFYEYVNHWRIKHAERLLLTSNFTIDEIASRSGFNSLSSFRRYFTVHAGMSPSKFRKQKPSSPSHPVG